MRVALLERVAIAVNGRLTPSTVVGLVGVTLTDVTLLAIVRFVAPETPL
jgi:hypothetical protein